MLNQANSLVSASVRFDAACNSQLFTTNEASHLLNVCRETVRKLIATGSLPPVRIGRSVRLRAGDLRTVMGCAK